MDIPDYNDKSDSYQHFLEGITPFLSSLILVSSFPTEFLNH